MSRVLCLDVGKKRTGVAVTDPLQISVNGLETVNTEHLFDFLSSYLRDEEVVKIVMGLPRHADGSVTALQSLIERIDKWIRKHFPEVDIEFEDESFSSKEARELMFAAALPKKKRSNKKMVDQVSAVLILQQHLKHR